MHLVHSIYCVEPLTMHHCKSHFPIEITSSWGSESESHFDIPLGINRAGKHTLSCPLQMLIDWLSISPAESPLPSISSRALPGAWAINHRWNLPSCESPAHTSRWSASWKPSSVRVLEENIWVCHPLESGRKRGILVVEGKALVSVILTWMRSSKTYMVKSKFNSRDRSFLCHLQDTAQTQVSLQECCFVFHLSSFVLGDPVMLSHRWRLTLLDLLLLFPD